MTRPTTTAFALLLAAAGAGCTVYPPEPTSPTFAKDIHPIFMAHCARCHGGGDMLRKELINDAEAPVGVIQCYLDRFDDRADCTVDDAGAPPVTCQPGAHTCATAPFYKPFLVDWIHRPESDARRMPPPPSPPLNEWELKVIDRWIANPLP